MTGGNFADDIKKRQPELDAANDRFAVAMARLGEFILNEAETSVKSSPETAGYTTKLRIRALKAKKQEVWKAIGEATDAAVESATIRNELGLLAPDHPPSE